MDVVALSKTGGYEAEVRIKETHFAHTVCGDEKSDAEEARESAAAILLAKYVTPEHTNSQRSRTRRPFRFLQNHCCVLSVSILFNIKRS